jgi:glycosyltransferase involved in cell wall biosynthesis
MRVLIATRHRGVVGGVETYLRQLVPALAARGHDLALLVEHQAAPGAGAVDEQLPGLAVWQVRPDWLGRDVLPWRPDVVFCQGLDDPATEETLLDHYPTVLFAHNYHGTCVSGTKCNARPSYEPCQRPLGLGCLVAYFPRRCGGLNPVTMLRLYRTGRRRRRGFQRYRAVLVASRHMMSEYRRNGVAAERVRLVPLFPTSATPDNERPSRRPRSDQVLFVGRITALKGLRHLIAALPLAAVELRRPLTLMVAGDGADRTEAEADARRLGVSATFLGWVGQDRRTEAMRTADVLAVPSVWPEPFGLVGVEAGCVGLPAVGYAVGGIPDWLITGVSGESAPGDRPDPVALAAALVRALRDDEHLQELRVGAWQVAQRFNLETHIEELERVLDDVASNRPRQVVTAGAT